MKNKYSKRIKLSIKAISHIGLSFVFIFSSICLDIKPVEAQAATSTQENLIGHWKFDEGTGSTINDSSKLENPASGNENHGTIVNGPSWVAGQSGTALYFDGKDDYIDLGDIAEFEFGADDAFTISLWLNATTIKEGEIFGRKNDSTYNWTWSLFTIDDSADFVNLAFGFSHHYNAPDVVYDIYKMDPAKWYHVAIVVGRQTNSEQIRFFINGNEITDKAVTRQTGESTYTDKPFRIGGELKFFEGIIVSLGAITVHTFCIAVARNFGKGV